MRLASKLFIASSLAVVVLGAVGAFSLLAVGRLVDAHREITLHTLPAVRKAGAVHDTILTLVRLETRYLVLRDPRFALQWIEQAARAKDDLDALKDIVTLPQQVVLLDEARAAFEAYRAVVAEEHVMLRRGDREGALALAEQEARPLADRVEAKLQELIDATHGAAIAAQAEAARLEAWTWQWVLTALAAAVVLALAGTAFVALRLTRSLRALSGATAAVAAGSFREPIPVHGGDEVADLAHAFNAMAARLRQLDQVKQAFLATTSHELRSPLTSIREAAHLLRDDIPGELNQKQARLVAIIEESVERLLRLVNQILELSRLRAGMMPLERRRLEVDRVVARAVEELRPRAVEAGVALAWDRVGEGFAVAADPDHLMQVAVNLVDNAIRFTPRGGRVTVRCVDAGPEVEVQVEDTGIGIPPHALPQIFDWYQQAHRHRGGTGLGLAVVRGLVELHGGRVGVESKEGRGSRFTVRLPRGREDA
jgi:two-component system, NtrC family, sensor histidine kinase GlrK